MPYLTRQEILKALRTNKIIMYKSTEPRYYKLINLRLHYSDNLEVWKLSKIPVKVFDFDSNWEVL